MKALIFDIKRFAVHDGPGIRVTVFFKGCSMSCWWCHNPEGISHEPEDYIKEINMDGKKICETGRAGQWITLEDLMKEVEKDRIFMENSGGGVTFSGGEPFNQPKFLISALRECNARSMHTCIDTSGNTTEDWIREAAGLTDLFLFDLKFINDSEHKKYTGISNEQILRNLETLVELKANINIRIPVIPGINDQTEQMNNMICYLSGLNGITSVDLLPYHNFARNKYKRFRHLNRLDGISKPTDSQLDKLKEQFESAGFSVKIGG